MYVNKGEKRIMKNVLYWERYHMFDIRYFLSNNHIRCTIYTPAYNSCRIMSHTIYYKNIRSITFFRNEVKKKRNALYI